MQKPLEIKLNIAGKSYSLTIDREKEEIYRKAEKEINTLVAKFESLFRSDTEGYLAMAALQLSLSNVELTMSRSLGEDIDALAELDKKLDSYFSELK